jgi:hypothetical protein
MMIFPEPSDVQFDENGESVPAVMTPPIETFVKKNFCYFEVATYASSAARASHSEPIYRTHLNFEPTLDAEAADILVQAYDHLKAQTGYEDAVDC